jgi:pimeloyl-ACP methyl ester carboxylesterase
MGAWGVHGWTRRMPSVCWRACSAASARHRTRFGLLQNQHEAMVEELAGVLAFLRSRPDAEKFNFSIVRQRPAPTRVNGNRVARAPATRPSVTNDRLHPRTRAVDWPLPQQGSPMRSPAIVTLSLLLALAAAPVHAATCPATADYAKAREIIADLNRIVAPGGVQESYTARIGGVDQWINVRGQDRGNPIILFVHGGPASPLTPTIWQFQRPIEEYFTVVNYDQRGAGKTLGEIDPESISDTIHIPRYVDDAIEVAEHIRAKYGQRKLVLVGHSWGTIVGMGAALKRPDLFHAYVGIGQVINVRENERISFDYALAQSRAHHNSEAVKALEAIAPYPGDQPITRERIVTARSWAQYYGGMSAYRASSEYFYEAPKLSPEYAPEDVCSVDEGNRFTLGRILPEFLQVDYSQVRDFPIPVVMFMGRHDYTTPSEPTQRWLDGVRAPYKQGVWFENASHMIQWEEPGKVLLSLVQHVRPLAVAPEKATSAAAP